MNRRRFLQLGTLGVLGTVGGAPLLAYSEAHRFGVSRHTVKLRGLKRPVRLVHLTDLHFGEWTGPEVIRRWVDAALAEQPDVIAVTGDIVHRLPVAASLEVLAPELQRLQAPLGVFAVLGNHDYWNSRSGNVTVAELVDRLTRAGLSFLTNAGRMVRDDLFVAGVDDFWHGSPALQPALRDWRRGSASVLLCHNPDFLPEVSADVGLTLCGHTHGGQVRLPGLRTIINVSKYGERFQQGFVQGDLGARGYVSRGLGYGDFPFRVFCPAELVVFTLEPA